MFAFISAVLSLITVAQYTPEQEFVIVILLIFLFIGLMAVAMIIVIFIIKAAIGD